MAGYKTINLIKDLEKELHELGMRWGYSRYENSGFGELVGIFPRDDQLPQYSRDAEIFSGTIQEVRTWIQGIVWARKYDDMMRVSDNKKRMRREQDLRNQQLVNILKGENKIGRAHV